MASNLGPLVALKGLLSKSHLGTPWPLGPTELLLERDRSDEVFLIEFSSEKKVRYLEDFQKHNRHPMWVYIAQVIREDALIYFGFSTLSERSLFEEIKEIKDVGPKTAASLVAELDPKDFLRLMNEGAWRGLKIAGVGPKTLESLVFGLNKRKKNILPLIDQALRAPQSSQATTSQEGELPTQSHSENSVTSTAQIPINTTWRPSLYASDRLVQMFEGLGLQAAQTHKLFDECAQSLEGFRELSDQQRVPLMLQRWGQTRLPTLINNSGATL